MAEYYLDSNGAISRKSLTEQNKKKKKGSEYVMDENGNISLLETADDISLDDDIGPVKKDEEEESKRSWFQSGVFEDGYQVGDIIKGATGTIKDLRENLLAGILGIGESVVDAGAYVAGGVGKLLGADGFADKTKDFISKELVDEEKVAKKIVNATTSPFLDSTRKYDTDDISFLGEKSDSLVQSAGQLAGTAGLQAVGVPWFVTTGLTSFGGEAENAFKQDATYGEAGLSAAISAGAEILTEKISGGIKFGGKTLDDGLTKMIARNISNKTVRTLSKLGMDMVGEGTEEVLSGLMSAIGQKITYADDKELSELFSKEDAWESFIGGAVLGGAGSVTGAVRAKSKGVDFVTELTADEQKVVDKVYQDEIAGKNLSEKEKAKIYDEVLEKMDKGYIDTDTIESVLGGESYSQYDSLVKESEEFNKLYETESGKLSERQKDRLAELKAKNEATSYSDAIKAAKEKLTGEVSSLPGRFAESYNEKARRGQAFEADVSKYNKKQQQTIQKAIDSGILNNTRRTHEFVDMIAKISADKGVLFDFTNNKKLKESGFAVDGKFVNGYVTKDGITVNLNSAKSLNSVVGHEITHVLEGTEFYNELAKVVTEYAKTKGEYQSRYDNLAKLYEGMENTNVDAELVADLVGDYLFTDSDFVSRLSTENRNVFQKIYDEIKYLVKTATAGSPEAKKLLEVQRAFEKAYRAEKNTAEGGGTKYSLFLNQEDIPDYLKAGNRQNKNRQKRYEEGQQMVISSDAEFEAFVKKAVDGNPNAMVAYGKVEDALAQQVKEKSNSQIDIEDAYLELLSDDVQHAYREHETAKEPGDMDMSIDELIYALKNVNQAEVVSARQYKDGGQRVTLATPTDDGMMLLVEVASKSAGTLRLKTGWKTTVEKFEQKYRSGTSTTGSKNSTNAVREGAASTDIVSENSENVKYSISDSNGKKLTKEQAEYFKDSKVTDENGNLKVMYRGDNADFSVFDRKKSSYSNLYGRGFYFTDSESHASQYGKAKAFYLDIKNPVSTTEQTITEAQMRKFLEAVAENEDDYSFENYGYGATVDSVLESVFSGKSDFAMLYDVSQTAIGDMVAAVELFNEVNGTDYDGLILDTETVVFNSNQIKSVANTQPTQDADIRFSLSDPVEQTKDLMALHNLSEQKLLKSLRLGGLPMPSVAIAKAQDGHNEFGEISLVLPREAIDPKESRNNKLYSGDAWTPTYPNVEYKVNERVLSKIESKLTGLVPSNILHDLGRISLDTDNMTDKLNRHGGDVVDAFRSNDALKYAYLVDNGADITLPMKEKQISYGSRANGEIIRVAEAIPADEIKQAMNGGSDEMRKLEPRVRQAVTEYWQDTYGDDPGALDLLVPKEALPFGELDGYLSDAMRYHRSGVERTVDSRAARIAIADQTIQSEYEKWLEQTFSGIVEKEGLRNNKDYFTPSGNRRSFEALHYEHNLENVIKAMRENGEKGVGSFGGGNIFGAATTGFSSVEEMKQASGRLQKMSDEEYQAMRDEFSSRFFEIARSLPENKSSFMAADDAANALVEAVAKYSTRSGIANYLRRELKGWATYSEQAVDDLIELVGEIRKMPTGYFEAKPQRAVSFDEVGVFIIPNNADVKLKQELLNRGYAIAEYDPTIEGHRQQVVNQFEEYKFSLSNVGGQTSAYGNYNVYGKDIALETEEDIAPMAETAEVIEAPMAENVFTEEEMFPDDNGPMEDWREQFESITDEDAPAETETVYDELGDEVELSQNAVKKISKTMRHWLGLSNKQMAEARGIIERYSQERFPAWDMLYDEISEKFGTYTEKYIDEELKEVKKQLRTYGIKVDPFIKSQIADFGDLQKRNFGKVRFSKDGLAVDSAYQEFQNLLPGYFPDSIDTPTDQLLRIIEVANMETEFTEDYEIDHDTLAQATDAIINGINEYKSKKLLQMANKQARETAKTIAKDEYAPIDMETVLRNRKPPVGVPMEELGPTFDTESGQQAMFEETEADRKITRAELHQNIVDGIKTEFAKNGLDLDESLKNAKNLSTFSTVDNTPQRVMEKALGWKAGKILSHVTVDRVARNESEGIKWLNTITGKDGLLSQLSKKYNIKPGSKEIKAVQMYAEGFYVTKLGKNGEFVKGQSEVVAYGDKELALDFPDPQVQKNIKALAKDPRIRKFYDDTLEAINKSRKRNGYPEIPRRDNYFLHFRAMEDTFSRLGLPFNPNDIKAKDLPTDLNGVTADLKPGQPYFASAMRREGITTTYDLFGGIERYATAAKNQIYHIDDIQTFRALRNYIADDYGQAKGLESIDALSEEEAQHHIEQVYNSHLSTFAKFLNEEANVLAGKTALIDRGLEGIIGRRGMTFLDTLNRQVGANMVGFNVSSSMTNFLSVVQAAAKTNKFDVLKAFTQTVASKVSGKPDAFIENNPTVIRRKGAEKFNRTMWQKASDAGYVLMSAVDNISTELIVRAKYNELTRKGMDAQEAILETDKWVSRMMGDRSLGQQPQLYNSKMLGLVTKFQLEVRNQLDAMVYDTIQEAKESTENIPGKMERNAKTAAKITSTFVQLAVAQHLFGKAFESVAGYNPSFDIISAIIKAFGWDDEEESEDTVLDNIEQGFMELMGDLPYVSTLTGGRIPISSALPIEELYKGKDQYGNEKSRWETLAEAAPYYLLPGGYGQAKKTVQGLGMFDDDLPIAGSYTDSGNLRFPVEDTLGNRVQAAIFGQYASGNARDYFDNEWAPLKEKQIEEYAELGLTINEYRKIREDLSKFDTLSEKANYIGNLELTAQQKNILINNLTDRKEPIDMTNYGDYGDFEEFDYAQKNPEKYAFLKSIGVSYADYSNADEDAKEAYDWAYKNPDKYKVSKVVSDDVTVYRQYTKYISKLSADKDQYGDTINGSKKEKVAAYINELDMEYGQKIILFKSQYPADDTYNYDIVDYLSSRDDISYEDAVTILKELGFEVHDDGRVTWD